MRKMPTGTVMQPRDMVAKLRGQATPTDWNNFMLAKHGKMTHDEANVALRGGQTEPQQEAMVQVQGPDGRMYEVPEGYMVVEGPGGTIRVVPEQPMDSDDGSDQPEYSEEGTWQEGDPVEDWQVAPPGYYPGEGDPGVDPDADGGPGYDALRDRRRMMR